MRRRFRPHKHVVKLFISELQKFPAPHLSSPPSFISFSAFLRKLVPTFEGLQFDSDLRSSFLLDTAVAKLPAAVHMKRNEYNVTSLPNGASFRVFSEALTMYSRACEDMPETTKHCDREKVRAKPTIFSVKKQEKNASIAFPMDNEKHHLGKCPDFLKKLVQERIKFVRSSNLCSNCLSPRHMIDDCESTVRCQVTNCEKRHTSLHRANQESASTSTKPGHSDHKNTPIQKITSSGTNFAENKASDFEIKSAFDTATRCKHQAASQLQTVPIHMANKVL